METITCNSIDELFKTQLDLSLNDNGWYFRGQPDASFSLLPSLWRDNIQSKLKKFEEKIDKEIYLSDIDDRCRLAHAEWGANHQPYENGSFTTPQEMFQSWHLYCAFEKYLVSNFYHVTNLAGLPVQENIFNQFKDFRPNDKIIRAAHDTKIGSESAYRANPISYELLDLFQHHGIPTRLLDFTTAPNIAIFFAAYNYLQYKPKATHIAIYALKLRQNSNFIQESYPSFYSLKILQNYYRYANKFLSSQHGLFVVIENADYFFWHNQKYPSIDDIYNLYQKPDHQDYQTFDLKKITLPIEYCSDLLKKLQVQGISISTMMPSYNHVAEQVNLEFQI
jgi:hypothetical protein